MSGDPGHRSWADASAAPESPRAALDPKTVEEFERLLVEARRLGFLGPDSISRHLEHSLGFADIVADALCPSTELPGAPFARLLDLGSGAGLPGLVLAASFPDLPVTLLDGSERRSSWLTVAVRTLDLDNVTVRGARAEAIGREGSSRCHFDVVTARAVGRPGVVAEYAAPLLRPGGILIVSEPPAPAAEENRTAGASLPPRWPPESLSEFGLGAAAGRQVRGLRFVVLVQERPCPDHFPRRVGVPTKRPRF